jgi:hypothetical protein
MAAPVSFIRRLAVPPVIAEKLPARIRDFPHAAGAVVPQQTLVDHRISSPLSRISPAREFRVGRQRLVIHVPKHSMHYLPDPIQDLAHGASAAQFNQHL